MCTLDLGRFMGGPCIYMAQGQFEDMKYASTYSNILPSHFDKVRDITRMTKIIGTLEESTLLSDKKKQELMAESRLLRGMTMFYLLHFYGPVPVILDPTLVGNLEAEREYGTPYVGRDDQIYHSRFGVCC